MNLLPIDETSAEGWYKHPLWCIPSKDSGKPVSMRGADICTFSDKEKQMLVSITFADFGIASFHSISFADYKRNKAVSVRSFKRPSTKTSRLSDSAVSDCSLTYYDNDLTISILKRKEHRHILMTAPELMLPSGEQGFKADITLTEIPEDESLSALIRNKEKGYIYTTRYIPLSVSGTVFIGDRIEKLSKNSTAGFTWTRSKGLGTENILDIIAFDNNEDGTRWGLSLSEASELRNAIIINGQLFKLGKCLITRPDDGISEKWHIEDESHSLVLDMKPSSNLHYRENLQPFKGETSEIFGIFRGSFRMPDGRKLVINESYGSAKMAAKRN